MTSALAAGGQSIFTALSFGGAGYLFKMFDKNGYEKEIKRHNLATEALVKAKEKFYEEEIKRKDKLQELRQEIADANQEIEQTKKALDRLRDFQSVTQSYKEPKIEDFYSPSPNMRKYQKITSVGMGVGTGLLVSRLI